MRSALHFQRSCGVCGRQLRVRVAYMGRQVACPHCGGRFVAQAATEAAPIGLPAFLIDPPTPLPPPADDGLLARVDALLKETAA